MVALLKMPFRLGSSEAKEADRRVFPRKEVQARLQGRRMDHSITAHRQPFLSLHTRDISAGGLGAISDRQLEHGERISVFFPPQGAQRGWDAYGRVVRCQQSAMGWRVGIEFDLLPAA